MSKLTKGILIGIVIVVVVGFVMVLTSFAMGASPYGVAAHLEDRGIFRYLGHWHDDRGADYDNIAREPDVPIVSNNLNNPAGGGTDEPVDLPQPGADGTAVGDDAMQQSADAYEIKNLKFDLAVGSFKLELGDQFAVTYHSERSREFFTESRDGDTWKIKTDEDKRHWLRDLHFGLNDVGLTITVPQDFVAEQIEIDLGAGEMTAEQLLARDVEVEVGMGSLQIGTLSAVTADVEVGMGEASIDYFQAEQADIKTGMGSIELGLMEPIESYRGKLSVAMGSVSFGENQYTGVSDINFGVSDAPYTLKLDCSMGAITVREQ